MESWSCEPKAGTNTYRERIETLEKHLGIEYVEGGTVTKDKPPSYKNIKRKHTKRKK